MKINWKFCSANWRNVCQQPDGQNRRVTWRVLFCATSSHRIASRPFWQLRALTRRYSSSTRGQFMRAYIIINAKNILYMYFLFASTTFSQAKSSVQLLVCATVAHWCPNIFIHGPFRGSLNSARPSHYGNPRGREREGERFVHELLINQCIVIIVQWWCWRLSRRSGEWERRMTVLATSWKMLLILESATICLSTQAGRKQLKNR